MFWLILSAIGIVLFGSGWFLVRSAESPPMANMGFVVLVLGAAMLLLTGGGFGAFWMLSYL